jgi:hypothetical protein
VKNLDVQGEVNIVRPFTYSHSDSSANYGHYNQPLAHPFGANFIEGVGIIRYQPLPKLTATAKLIYWRQGVDTGASNYGTNIFKLYSTRSGDYGYKLPSGIGSTGINAQLSVSYEVKGNWTTNSNLYPKNNTSVATVGLRMKMFRRVYDY